MARPSDGANRRKAAPPSSATRKGNGYPVAKYAKGAPTDRSKYDSQSSGPKLGPPAPRKLGPPNPAMTSSAYRRGNGYTATMSAKPATPTAPRSTPRTAPVASSASPAATTAARPSGTASDLRARRTVATAPPAQAVAAAVPPAIPYSSPYVQPQLTRQPLFDISGNYIGPVGAGAPAAPATPAAAAISAAFDPEAYRSALMSQFDAGQYIAPVAGNPNTVINAQGIPTVQRTMAEAALLPLRSATATQLASAEYRQLLEELLNEARARGEL